MTNWISALSFSLVLATGETPSACQQSSHAGLGAPFLRVALHMASTRTDDPARRMIDGDRFALVRLDAKPMVTLHAVASGSTGESFRRALERPARPARSDEVVLHLPLPPSDLFGVFLDVVFFADRNGNARLDAGEPYAAASSGARGTYRAIFLDAPRGNLAGSAAGWNVCEGGEPAACTPDVSSRVFSVNPVVEPVTK